MNFSVKNFAKQNTPPVFQKIGDICLVISAIGAVIATLPGPTETMKTIGIYAAAIGAIGKILTKFAGV